MSKFQVMHAVKGNRLVEVELPDDVQLPKDWEDMCLVEKDEWLYEHQTSSSIKFEDMEYAEAITVEQV